ncbi:glycosyltransferase [Enterococcus gallinarum]|uniref:glycosyltransferase n=1 Tax=Enterococcus gallinarum TaxID=1353 RepID=UPI0015586B5E|nr:glycosyltransferase [Enterococcus gallinarum]NQE01023.1 glycosyltransferase family 4 protein [Enterococcus gallinarum]
MRIIHVEDRFEPLAGYQINELIKEQVELNYDITIITSDLPIFSDKSKLGELDKEFQKNYPVRIIRLKPLFILSQRYYFHKLFRLLDSLQPDLVFLHGIVDFKDLILLKSSRKYIIVRDCHMSWVASKNKFSKILPTFYSLFFSKIVNTTTKYKKIYSLGIEETQYLQKLKINESKIEDLYHGYNSKDMFYSKEYRKKLRKKYAVKETEVFIGYIGKFDSAKQPDLIFDILNKIDKKYLEKIKVLFVGNLFGEYGSKFLKKAEKSILKENIFYENAQPYENLYKYYSALDICVWPKETTLSSIHAQVCNTIPIMEDHLSNRERVIENKYLYEIDNLEDAGKKIEQAIDNLETINFESMTRKIHDRDYTYRVKILSSEWESMLNEKKNN